MGMRKCSCGHSIKDHYLYAGNGVNSKGSRYVCTKDNCSGWNLCDIGITKKKGWKNKRRFNPMSEKEENRSCKNCADFCGHRSELVILECTADNYKYWKPLSTAQKERSDIKDILIKMCLDMDCPEGINCNDCPKVSEALSKINALVKEAEKLPTITLFGNTYYTNSIESLNELLESATSIRIEEAEKRAIERYDNILFPIFYAQIEASTPAPDYTEITLRQRNEALKNLGIVPKGE